MFGSLSLSAEIRRRVHVHDVCIASRQVAHVRLSVNEYHSSVSNNVIMFTVRRADSNDVEALVSLRLALLRDIGHIRSGISDDELESLIEVHRQCFTRTIPTEHIAFVAVSAGTIVEAATAGSLV